MGAPLNALRGSPDDPQPQRGKINQPGAEPRGGAGTPASEALEERLNHRTTNRPGRSRPIPGFRVCLDVPNLPQQIVPPFCAPP